MELSFWGKRDWKFFWKFFLSRPFFHPKQSKKGSGDVCNTKLSHFVFTKCSKCNESKASDCWCSSVFRPFMEHEGQKKVGFFKKTSLNMVKQRPLKAKSFRKKKFENGLWQNNFSPKFREFFSGDPEVAKKLHLPPLLSSILEKF